jgi:hypothetical protein
MTTPFEDALLALNIAVDALHESATAAPGAEKAASDALVQIGHLGFDVRPSGERAAKSAKWVRRSSAKSVQRTLFS